MQVDLLTKILPGVLVAIFSSFLAAWLTMRKFYTEKWWDRKEKAYTEIINALYNVVQFYEVFKEDYGQDDLVSEQCSLELRQGHSNGFRTLRRATDLATLYISDDAVKVLKNLQKRDSLDYEQNPLWDVYENEYQHHNEALEQLIEIATTDLKCGEWKQSIIRACKRGLSKLIM